jgi:hypothetical protein
MSYTKEQAEMLALLVLMGCAVIVLSFLYLVKPNFATIAECKAELKKADAEIANLNKAKVTLARLQKERDSVVAAIRNGEGAVFAGLEVNPPLSDVCVRAANEVNLKPAYGAQTSKSLLEFRERAADGKEVARHYDDVQRTLDVHSSDFFTLCRFLSAVENANKGLRVTHLEIGNESLEQQEQEKGEVRSKIELSMLGIREGERTLGEVIDVSGYKDFDVGQKRNPFGPAGGVSAISEDPGRRIKEILSRLKITGIWSDRLILEVAKDRSITVQQNQTFAVAGLKMVYVAGSADSFLFEAVDYGKRYKITTNWRGEVKTVTEEDEK